MVQVTPQAVPKEWRSTVDLFEVGFLYVFLPLVVSTMDRPPLYLGGKILLWMVSWFFLRRLGDLSGGAGWSSKAIRDSLLSLGAAGLVSAVAVGFRWVALDAALRSLLAMAVMVVPACALVFLYLPKRLAASEWIPGWLRPLLPAIAFAGLHLSSGLWQAPLLALAGGYVVARWKLPLGLAVFGQWSVAMAGALWLW